MARILKKGQQVTYVIDEVKQETCSACRGLGWDGYEDEERKRQKLCIPCKNKGVVEVTTGESVRFKLQSFSADQQDELNGLRRMVSGVDKTQEARLVRKTLSMAVKSVTGLWLDEEKSVPYVVQVDPETGYLTEDCADELMNCQVGPELTIGCLLFLKGVASRIEPLEGRPARLRYEFPTLSPNAPSPVQA